jgi:hypothetical protein
MIDVRPPQGGGGGGGGRELTIGGQGQKGGRRMRGQGQQQRRLGPRTIPMDMCEMEHGYDVRYATICTPNQIKALVIPAATEHAQVT